MSATAKLAISCTDVEVHYTVRAHRPLIRDMLRGQRPAAQYIEAVRGVTFDVHVGESVGGVGPNGSGKTTLLQATTGLVPLAGGTCRVRSIPTFLGVSAVLRNQMTGRRNIQIGLLAQGLRQQQADEMADGVIDFTGLGDFIDMRMETYSSGMRARLHFAIATALSPEILLIDEALAVGDRSFREKSAQRLDEHRAAAGTVLLVSHNLAEIRRSCSRVIWLEDGLIVHDGPTDEVLEAYEAS
ncbi:MAG TPA: ABC transporter ATP-binding protein [Acidimicrobiia bacterium]|nr:ABC transporter ATP-binding protein [Acidimicrobiia bacterium]